MFFLVRLERRAGKGSCRRREGSEKAVIGKDRGRYVPLLYGLWWE
jgi:hypothetical protein